MRWAIEIVGKLRERERERERERGVGRSQSKRHFHRILLRFCDGEKKGNEKYDRAFNLTKNDKKKREKFKRKETDAHFVLIGIERNRCKSIRNGVSSDDTSDTASPFLPALATLPTRWMYTLGLQNGESVRGRRREKERRKRREREREGKGERERVGKGKREKGEV